MINRTAVRKGVILLASVVVMACFAEDTYCQTPVKVTLCELKTNPRKYNQQLIEVSGFVSHEFEDFSLFDPECTAQNSVWLEYGGVIKSGTMYCCGVTSARTRRKPLVVEKIKIPLVDDNRFREFDRQVNRYSESNAHATIVGRFFSGKPIKFASGEEWGGYGHMGCCSLLAIQQIVSVDAQDRDDLYYGGSSDLFAGIDFKVGCGYGHLDTEKDLDVQRKTDNGGRDWAFTDPTRVAVNALSSALKIEEASVTALRQTGGAQGRVVYRWHPQGKTMSYIIVVTRPFWLTYYAKDPKRIAWVATRIFELTCGENNPPSTSSLK